MDMTPGLIRSAVHALNIAKIQLAIARPSMTEQQRASAHAVLVVQALNQVRKAAIRLHAKDLPLLIGARLAVQLVRRGIDESKPFFAAIDALIKDIEGVDFAA